MINAGNICERIYMRVMCGGMVFELFFFFCVHESLAEKFNMVFSFVVRVRKTRGYPNS